MPQGLPQTPDLFRQQNAPQIPMVSTQQAPLDPAQAQGQIEAVEGPYEGGWASLGEDPITQALMLGTFSGLSIPKLFANLAMQTAIGAHQAPDLQAPSIMGGYKPPSVSMGEGPAAQRTPTRPTTKIAQGGPLRFEGAQQPQVTEHPAAVQLQDPAMAQQWPIINAPPYGYYRGPIGRDVTLTDYLANQGLRIPESYKQSPDPRFPDRTGFGTGLGPYGQPDWITPEEYAKMQQPSQFTRRDPEPAGYSAVHETGPDDSRRGAFTRLLKPEELTWERAMTQESMEDLLPPEVASRLGPWTGPPPSQLLFHGLSVPGLPQDAISTLGGIQESGGLQKGMFANVPRQHFGPLFAGVEPKNLPPITIRNRMETVDPPTEIMPGWTASRYGSTRKAEYKGKPYDAPELSIHPSQVAIADAAGNLYGSAAAQRPGIAPTTAKEYTPWRFQRGSFAPQTSAYSGGPMTPIMTPAMAERNLRYLEDEMKEYPKPGTDDYRRMSRGMRRLMEKTQNQIDDIKSALASEPKPTANYPTTILEDIGKLFEEAE